MAGAPGLDERVGGKPVRLPPRGGRGRDGGEKRVFQNQLGVDDVVFGVGAQERGVVHQGGLGLEFLCHDAGLDRRLNRGFLRVTLVDHVGDLRHAAPIGGAEVDLGENAENLIRIDRATGRVVGGVAPVVEVKTAEHVLVEEPREDLFDILGVVMRAGIDEHLRARAGPSREEKPHAPVGDVGSVERVLERFVFDQHRLLRTELLVERTEGIFERLLTGANAALAGIVRAVGEIEREAIPAAGFPDSPGVHAMRERGRVVVTEGTPLVALVLKRLG